VYYPQCDKLFGAPSWFFTTKPPRANALTMSFYPELDQASFKQLTELWGGDIPGWADSRDSLLDEIAYSLAESGEAGVAFLKGYGRADDLAQRRAAVYFLAAKHIIDVDILQDLDAAFYDDDLGLKIRALLSYMNLEQFSILRADIDALLDHPNDWVSAVAMQYLSRAYPAETIEILAQALSSPNPRQREYACDEVGDNYINELADQLKALLNDPDDRAQEAARCNLEFLIG
jgi:hypothetical protein